MAKSRKNTWILWSEDEIKLLRKLFPLGRAKEISGRIGRPLTALRQKAYHLWLKTRENRLWTANEVKLLKKHYLHKNPKSIADNLTAL